jgi:hypothetical protein
VNYYYARIKAGKSLVGGVSTGRPRKTTPKDDALIVRQVMKSRRASCPSIREELGFQSVSVRTVERRIMESGLFNSGWTKRKSFVSEVNRVKRVAWAKEHLNWSLAQWHSVIWSDESPFVLRYNRKTRCYRLKGDYYNPETMTGTVKHDAKLMVWGCFAAHGVGKLHRIQGIMVKEMYHQILIHQLRPSANILFPNGNYIFQQDNDPKHTAIIIRNYINNTNLPTMDWPAQSPDLNPIENLWSILDNTTKSRKPQNLEELFDVLNEAWKTLPVDRLTQLVDSMPDRCRQVIESKGYPIRY